jgi:hypothetical protein
MAKDSFAFLGFLQPLKIPTELCPRTVDHFWENFSDKLDGVLGKFTLMKPTSRKVSPQKANPPNP